MHSCGSGQLQLHWCQEPVRTMINVPRLGTVELFKLIWNDFLILKWMERRFLWTILISFFEKKLTSHRAVYLSAVTILYDQTSLICISICSQNLIKWKVAPIFVFGDLHHHNMTLSSILDCMEVCCCKNGQLTDWLLDVRNLGEENVWQKNLRKENFWQNNLWKEKFWQKKPVRREPPSLHLC